MPTRVYTRHRNRGAHRDQRVLRPSIFFNPQIGCCGDLKPLLIYSKYTTENNKAAVRMYVPGKESGVMWVNHISPMTGKYNGGLESQLGH